MKASIKKLFPLTQSQMGIYFECVKREGEIVYNTPIFYKLLGHLDLNRLATAIDKAVAAHPLLFARITTDDDGMPVMQFCEEYSKMPACSVEKVSEVELDVLKPTLIQPYSLSKDRLFRIRLFETEENQYMFMEFHHVVFDGTSRHALLTDINKAYLGENVQMEAFTGFDVALKEQDDRKSDAYLKAKEWSLQTFGEVEETSVPVETITKTKTEVSFGKQGVVLGITYDEMKQACKEFGVGPSILTNAAYGRLLSAYTNKRSAAFATIYNGRKDELTARTVCFMVKTLPVYYSMKDNMTVRQYVDAANAQMADAKANDIYAFSELAAQTSLNDDVMFAFQGRIFNVPAVDNVNFERLPLEFNSTSSALNLQLSVMPDGRLFLDLQYQSNRYSEDFIQRLADSYETVLREFMKNPDALVYKTSIMSEKQAAELEQMRQTCMDSEAIRFNYFHESIEYWAEQTPDAVAVIASNETLTYSELNNRANALAAVLMKKGVVAGDRVCLLLPRKSWYLIAMFGVLKSGAAYIPCDPEYPSERIKLITEDSHARFVITTKDKMEPFGERALDVEELLNENENENEPTPQPLPKGKGLKSLPSGGDLEEAPLAYLIYTSGSTGRPKGVMLRHRGICNYLTNHAENRHIHAIANECNNVLGITTVSFDLSLKEIGASLFNGKTLVLANEEETTDPITLAALMEKTHVDVFNGTPSRLKMFLELPEFQNALKKCHCIILGGEKYPTNLLIQLKEIVPDARLFNTYGPTEITVSSNVKELTHSDVITVGPPLLNVKEYVVDNDGNELPVGVVGELYIGGEGVSAGYNDLPEKTTAAFIDYKGERIYKSGDYAYWTAEGDVVILGRKDNQIKLNGLRIELGEVETVLNKQPQVKEGVVMIKSVKGHDHLVAYYTGKNPASTDESSELKEQMSKSLTPYMVPTIFMKLDKMPISPNGKTDLKSLPEPVLTSTKNVAPANEKEQQLFDVAAKVIGNDKFGVTTNLISAGLTSLLAIRFSVEVNKSMKAILSVKDIMHNPTIRELANVYNENEGLPHPLPKGKGYLKSLPLGGDLEEALHDHVITLYPLSENQRGVYIDWELHRDALQYNMPSLTEYDDIDAERLRDAICEAINAHPYMKTRLVMLGEDVMQQPHYDEQPQVMLVNVYNENENDNHKPSTLPSTGSRQANHQPSDWQSLVTPFDLFNDCLYRYEIYQDKKAGKVWLFADRHHIISDGISNGILERDIWRAYNGEKLEPEQFTALDNAVEQKRLSGSKKYAEAEKYFDKLLTGAETTVYPHSLNEGQNIGKRVMTLNIPGGKINAFCQKEGITPSNYFLSAFSLVLHRAAHEDSVFLVTVNNGRDDLRLTDTVGMFVKTLPVTSNMAEGETHPVAAFVHAMQEQQFDTQSYDFYPFTKMVERHGVHPEIMYVYQAGLEKSQRGKRHSLNLDTVKMPLELMVFSSAKDTYQFSLSYDSALYNDEDVHILLDMMASASANMLTSETMEKVSLLSDEQKALIDTFHDGKKADVPIKLYHKLLEASVEAHPDHLALVAIDQQLTYREMNCQMDRIAHSLISRGIKCGDRVALLLPRTSRLILSQFGVLKAGGAYIPCDPKYPTERINLILSDSGAALIITTADRLAEFPGRSVDVEELLNENENENEPTPQPLPKGKGLKSLPSGGDLEEAPLAYLIYTSGSTGVPKGVQLTHEGVCNYHCPQNLIQSTLAQECNAALAITTISFDMSVWETGSPLMLGKTLVLASDDQCNDPIALAELIDKYEIGCMTATTSRYLQLLECEEFENAFRKNIRMAYQGGEGLSKVLLEKLRSYGNIRIFNGYGPTETIANSHAAELTDCDIPHIGKPCCNYCNYIVDRDGNELPVGVVGELLIGGDSVAKGYNNLPEQTAKRFVANPYKNDGSRLYHSGDYARWLPDGNVVVLGRTDNQVKLRGLRIELGEVENAIVKVSGIKNAVAMIKKLQGQDHLCAYFTAEKQINIEELKEELKKTLTLYMIPTAYLQLEEFPLTPNGKTNVKVLPEPIISKIQTEHVKASSGVEEDFCKIFADVLELDEVGATDNFFEIGGTSLVAMRVVMRAVKAGYKIVYKDVFDYPTPRYLAGLVNDGSLRQAQDGLSSPTNDNENPKAENRKIEKPENRKTALDYDYSKINHLLAENQVSNFISSGWKSSLRELGTCVVTGATGFLGIHVVKELIDREDVESIYCMVRSNAKQTAASRLRTMLFYYFGSTYSDLFDQRIFIIDGDVTKSDWTEPILQKINNGQISGNVTVFNCAANVKHFSAGTDIEDINIGGCQTCIDFCLKTGARLIQTSTHSIAGSMISDEEVSARELSEHDLFIGQSLVRQYTHAKFIAERNVLEAICEKALDAKIMRYGNLAARSNDGEFQVNFHSNGFMGRLKAYQTLGAVSFENLAKMVEFSPINEVAHATVLLATTPKQFTVFNPNNSHCTQLSDVVVCMNRMGYNIKSVEKSEFDEIVLNAGQDATKADILQSLLAYNSNMRGKHVVANTSNNSFTTQVLYRLGFQWSFTTWDYMERFLKVIQGLGFFDDDYQR